MTSEQQIEQALITKLTELKYAYRPDIRSRATLEQNFRAKFEALNKVTLTDAEFAQLQGEIVTADVFAASKTLRTRNTFMREDGTPLHYTLVNIKDWCKNDYEVINQLRINTSNSHHRYDVILLINGVPVVQVELKTLEVSPRRAMAQIVDYKNDHGNGYTNSLLCFMQLFIVSNNSNTYYFANNHNQHFSFNADERFLPVYQFASEDNQKITQLHAFANKFLPKCLLGEMISRYMVLVASEQKLLVMRPYQIYAVKAIVDCIQQNRGNGYIWHTTGSGKTLTSFKAATLLKDNPEIEKCLFVVDRKDLDRQTREEFNKFQDGCVEENTNTETLVRRMLSEDYADKVIVTTIQKLGLALDENSKRNLSKAKEGKQTYKERLAPLRAKRVVFIFDECHRSQFGDNHQAIKEFFPNAQLFGFTGTPIFEQNASYQQIDGDEASYKTTADIFEKQLHAYTITHAIDDNNVLRFHIDYFKPELHGNTSDKQKTKAKPSEAISQQAVAEAILTKHDGATNQRRFNALLATASINHAIEYHRLFTEIQAKRQLEDENFKPLNIACVFSPPAEDNKDVQQLQEDLPQEKADNSVAPDEKKAALKAIIAAYNTQYNTNHSITEFDLYYQDVQQRIKDHQYSNADYPHHHKIDVMIVVDMLLTGFDSKYLNTLYVDKNLKYHGLIQALSRTNRILNDTKPYGNILDFRQQEQAVKDAIALFSGSDFEAAKKYWLVDAAPVVIEKLDAAIATLQNFMHSQGVTYAPAEVNNLKGDDARGQFINLFKEVQRLKTQLDQYTDVTSEQSATIEAIIPEDTLRAFKSMYLETAQRLKKQQDQGKDNSDAVQQLDFEFVLFSSSVIDYDYIMGLIAQYTQAAQNSPAQQKASRDQVIGLLLSDAKLLDEREDITDYINQLKTGVSLSEKQIRAGYDAFKAAKAAQVLSEMAAKHQLDGAALQSFVDTILRRMIFDGEQLSDLFSARELGWKERSKAELALMEDLLPLLKKLANGTIFRVWLRMNKNAPSLRTFYQPMHGDNMTLTTTTPQKPHQTFEDIKHIDAQGDEFWYARALAKVLDYSDFRNFVAVIEKALNALEQSDMNAADHIVEVTEMIEMGKGAQKAWPSFALSRHACYLIVQNADPSKPVIANGQIYFAIQARRQELADDTNFQALEEDKKRLFLRNELKLHNKQLVETAAQAGVSSNIDFAVFQNHGYKGLYGGLDAKGIQAHKGLKKSQKILDHMGSTELAANLFRATQTEEKLKRDQIHNKTQANRTHFDVGQKIRQTIAELGGTMPEALPVPDKSISNIEQEQQKKRNSVRAIKPEDQA